MSDSPSEKSPVDKLLDLGVYAPLGLLLTRDKVIDELAQAGRQQVEFSRSLGRAALKGLARGVSPRGDSAEASVQVAGYDDMTARQVIELVGSCTADQAAWIRTRETEGKNRVTVLRALDARSG